MIQNDKLKNEIFCIYLIQAKIFNLHFIDLGEYKFDFTNKTNLVGLAKIPVLGCYLFIFNQNIIIYVIFCENWQTVLIGIRPKCNLTEIYVSSSSLDNIFKLKTI